MKTGPAIALWVAGLSIAGIVMAGLATIGQPGTGEPPQLSALLPPLLDRLGSLALEWLQWLALALKRS